MLRLGRAMGQAMRAHRPSLPGFSRAKSATPTATAAGSNINRTIDLLKTRLEEQGISVVTTGARVKAKSRDYYWFSPVLRGRLADKAADAFIAPENEAEVVEVLRACHELGVPVTVRGTCIDPSSVGASLSARQCRTYSNSGQAEAYWLKTFCVLLYCTTCAPPFIASRRWNRELWPGCAITWWCSA